MWSLEKGWQKGWRAGGKFMFFYGIYRFVLGFSMGFYQHMEKRWNKHALSPKHGNYDWNIMDFTPTKIPWEGDLQSGGLCNISHKWM
jgi:hypothetical protein